MDNWLFYHLKAIVILLCYTLRNYLWFFLVSFYFTSMIFFFIFDLNLFDFFLTMFLLKEIRTDLLWTYLGMYWIYLLINYLVIVYNFIKIIIFITEYFYWIIVFVISFRLKKYDHNYIFFIIFNLNDIIDFPLLIWLYYIQHIHGI